eukprot:scaffold140862_cov163-Phaeocystis_antarctica.AAC.1
MTRSDGSPATRPRPKPWPPSAAESAGLSCHTARSSANREPSSNANVLGCTILDSETATGPCERRSLSQPCALSPQRCLRLPGAQLYPQPGDVHDPGPPLVTGSMIAA